METISLYTPENFTNKSLPVAERNITSIFTKFNFSGLMAMSDFEKK